MVNKTISFIVRHVSRLISFEVMLFNKLVPFLVGLVNHFISLFVMRVYKISNLCISLFLLLLGFKSMFLFKCFHFSIIFIQDIFSFLIQIFNHSWVFFISLRLNLFQPLNFSLQFAYFVNQFCLVRIVVLRVLLDFHTGVFYVHLQLISGIFRFI